jgi:transcriptional regulator with PAS, ATPase and Fis domain
VTSELAAARRERDFYRSLVELHGHDDLASLLRAALDLLVARGGARETVVEVMRDDGVSVTPAVVAHGCEGHRLAEISAFISRGIISEAMATGETVVTANATEDPRFHAFDSVQRQGLEAVLCVPIGHDPPIGVAYLQGTHGSDEFQPYDDQLQRDVELAARSLAAALEKLSARTSVASIALPPVAADDPFSAVRGRSPAIREIIERLRLAAPLDVHVLLTGASGVGKTMLASAIHLASRRRNARFVEINCATLPDALLENELFGAEPGAHSAVPRGGVRGKVDSAEGGTLFLDEVAELSIGAQAKLLQLLQSKTYYRLGGTELRRADIRVIAATNVNLKGAVAEKKFREDLYYRLQVLEARVPSLAERVDDLLPLAVGFLKQSVERHQLPHKTLSPSAMRAIQAAEWPGNVRELAHRLESATIHAHLRGSDRIEGRDVFPGTPSDDELETFQAATRRCQRKHIRAVLSSTDWNVLETARLLDLSRSQVYNLIRAFEIKRD